MKYKGIRRFFHSLRRTPFHPQWLIARQGKRRFSLAAEHASGVILDIGCSGQMLKNFLSPDVVYIGMDYLNTASGLYGTEPAVYGAADKLPFKDASLDTVSLLEVLEHLKTPYRCFGEIFRVIKPGGALVLSTPFLYPVHDEPYDFQRFTHFGLHAIAEESGFLVEKEFSWGHPVTTALLLLNLSLVKTTLDGFNAKSPMALLIFILPVLVPLFNICGWIFDLIGSSGTFMALSYSMVLRRK